MILPRLAPRASRTAISFCRDVERASSKPATLAQAMDQDDANAQHQDIQWLQRGFLRAAHPPWRRLQFHARAVLGFKDGADRRP